MDSAFQQFLDKLDQSTLNNWWTTENESDVPKDKSGWKYKFEKDGKSFPVRYVFQELSKLTGKELTGKDLTSSDSTRNRFAEKFGLSINESLNFDSTEKKKLQQYFAKVQNKAALNCWISHCSRSIEMLQIDPYHIRMGISKGALIVELGARKIWSFQELQEGEVRVRFILSEDASIKFQPDKSKIHQFGSGDKMTLTSFGIKAWDDLPAAMFYLNQDATGIEYSESKNKKLSDIRKGASTTNAALKYVIYCNQKAEDFITHTTGNAVNQHLTTKNKTNMPRVSPNNIILYGPPGTGKTYSTKAYAVALAMDGTLNSLSKWLANDNRKECLTQWNELKAEKRVEFVTFHQSMSYEDFVQGIRPNVKESTLAFKRVNGIFKKLSDEASTNYKNHKSSSSSLASFETVFDSFISPLVNEDVNEIAVDMRSKQFFITGYDEDYGTIHFRKSSGGTGDNLLTTNLKAIYEGGLQYRSDGLGVYYHPLVKRLKDITKKQFPQGLEEPLKQFILVIDEINRANISRVLGELITLLEPDKRLGAKDELTVTLPSGEQFSVPPNLHIIGTMNTADKSIAHLDVALRRRFKFQPLYPDSSLVKDPIKKAVLEALNKRIVEEGNPDLTIGHSYFMGDDDVETIMNEKVLPLLHEYFSQRTEQVGEILKAAKLNYEQDPFGLLKCIGFTSE